MLSRSDRRPETRPSRTQCVFKRKLTSMVRSSAVAAGMVLSFCVADSFCPNFQARGAYSSHRSQVTSTAHELTAHAAQHISIHYGRRLSFEHHVMQLGIVVHPVYESLQQWGGD